MKSPLAGMNGPLAGIALLEHGEASCRRQERNGAAGPAALKIPATREDPDGLRRLAAGLQCPVPRADETADCAISRCGNGKEMKQMH